MILLAIDVLGLIVVGFISYPNNLFIFQKLLKFPGSELLFMARFRTVLGRKIFIFLINSIFYVEQTLLRKFIEIMYKIFIIKF